MDREYTKCAAAAVAMSFASIAAGSITFDFTISPSSELRVTEGQVDAQTSGTLIGDYDAETNPEGTRTKPGLFGSFEPTENLPVPVTVDGSASGTPTIPTAGSFLLHLDVAAGSVMLSDLISQMGGPADGGMEVDAVFHPQESFRTRNPDSSYLAVAVPVSMGTATLTSFSLVQTAAASGTLTGTGPDTFDFEVVAPVELSAEFELMGDVFSFGPEVGQVPLTGTIVRSGGTAQLTSLAPLDISQTENPGEPLETMPFGLPTLSGDTANVLLDLVLDELTILLQGELETLADGTAVAPSIAGDATLDGQVTIADLGVLAANWQQTDRYWQHGDFNFDGAVTIADLGVLAGNWQAGVGEADGSAVGFDEAMGMFDAFDGVVVPEPAGVGMVGLAGLLALRRRRLGSYRAA